MGASPSKWRLEQRGDAAPGEQHEQEEAPGRGRSASARSRAEHQLAATSRRRAPNTGPNNVPTPPRTTMMMSSPERVQRQSCRADEVLLTFASSTPANAAQIAPAMTKATSL